MKKQKSKTINDAIRILKANGWSDTDVQAIMHKEKTPHEKHMEWLDKVMPKRRTWFF